MGAAALGRQALLGFAVVAAAQSIPAGGAAAQVNTLVPDSGASSGGAAKFNIAIRNDTGQSLQFQLRPKDAAWTTYPLGPGEKGVYTCTGCGGTFEVRISTAGSLVDYTIQTGALYAIRINAERQIYDVYKIP